MTIKQTLESWRLARVAKLEECGAPFKVIEAEKLPIQFNRFENIDKYGDLEVVSTTDWEQLQNQDPGLSEVRIFYCGPYGSIPILMFWKIEDGNRWIRTFHQLGWSL